MSQEKKAAPKGSANEFTFGQDVDGVKHRQELELAIGGILPDLGAVDAGKLRHAITVASQLIDAKDPSFVGEGGSVQVVVSFGDDSLGIAVARV